MPTGSSVKNGGQAASPAERRFIDSIGLFYERQGGTRIMGLIHGWLTICAPAHESITDIARVLGVSKASVSTTIRQLEAAEMVERVPVPGTRQHHYQLRTGGWTQIMRSRFTRVTPVVTAADEMLARSGTGDDASRVERLEELRDFFDFVHADTETLTQRWEEFRKNAIAERARAARAVRRRG